MLDANEFPELFFGLVGPIGVDMATVEARLQTALMSVGYQAFPIRVTEIMRDVNVEVMVEDTADPLKHYMSRIKYANSVRKKCQNNAALSGLTMIRIREIRKNLHKSNGSTGTDLELEERPLEKTAFIIRQFKRREEIDLFRKVYGRKFIQISVNSHATDRKRRLSQIMASQNPDINKDKCDKFADELISIDLNERSESTGQRVEDIFHLGDVFVDDKSGRTIEQTVFRFVDAFFGKNSISPTIAEYATYTAASAALRSIDTSRQVGAAIFTDQGEVVSIGTNEVPKAGGGTYWCDDPEPHRDMDEGHDANNTQKRRILFDIIRRLKKADYLSKKRGENEIFQEIMGKEIIDDSLMMDLTEFGRMTHAEMNAITDAARLGRPLKGTVMYCTTFPCHNCAKHIVASGISKVIFIEPYPKSKALELHDDAISINNDDTGKVLFTHFYGISPRRYRDIFEKQKRRNPDGTLREWYEGSPAPRIEDRGPSHAYLEPSAIAFSLSEILEEIGLAPPQDIESATIVGDGSSNESDNKT